MVGSASLGWQKHSKQVKWCQAASVRPCLDTGSSFASPSTRNINNWSKSSQGQTRWCWGRSTGWMRRGWKRAYSAWGREGKGGSNCCLQLSKTGIERRQRQTLLGHTQQNERGNKENSQEIEGKIFSSTMSVVKLQNGDPERQENLCPRRFLKLTQQVFWATWPKFGVGLASSRWWTGDLPEVPSS